MFWERLIKICNERGTSPTAVVKALKISGGSVTKWKNGSIPNGTTLLKLADYFGVSVEYLKGKTDTVISGEISDAERKILEAYRTHPEMHDAINKLLGIGSS